MHTVLIPNPSASIHGLSRVDQEAGGALPDVPDERLAVREHPLLEWPAPPTRRQNVGSRSERLSGALHLDGRSWL